MGKQIKTLVWGFKLAWKIDKKMLMFWMSLTVMLSVFPALILSSYKQVLSGISQFLNSGNGAFGDIVGSIVLLGVLITISGLSGRLNQSFLYMTMYDSFYLGLEEVLMESAQRIDLIELVKADVNDEYRAAMARLGALTDVTSSGCALLGSIVSIGSILVVSITISPVICISAIVYVAFILWLNSHMTVKARVVNKDVRKYQRKAMYFKSLVEEGDTAKEVRIFQSVEMIKNGWRRAIHKVDSMYLRRDISFAEINLVCQCGFYLFLGAMMIFALLMMRNGQLEADSLLMLFTLGISLSQAVADVPACYQQMDYGLYGLELQKKFYERTPMRNEEEESHKFDTPADETVCFEANHLSFAYPGGKPVLKDVSFKIHKGETIALVGVNGCGKSTLLKIMMGLYRVEPGMLKFQGREYREYKQGYFTQKIGAFFQDFFIFHLTVKENVGIGNIRYMENEEMLWSALTKGGIADLVRSWKNGIHQRLKRDVYRDGKMLSGGESQRLAVARTHMSDKDILIFDEPASMLDPLAELDQFNHIKNKIAGHTAILVSHRIGFARLADRIIVLNNGCIEEEGTHEELLKNNGLYTQLFCDQAQWYDLSGVKEGGRS